MGERSEDSGPARRVWPYVVAGILIVISGALVAVFVFWRVTVRLRDQREQAEEARATREARAVAVTEIAPVAVPTSLPLLGEEGRDAYGYPTRFVDRAGFRSLLHAARYADLTRYFELLQDKFEEDPREEYAPLDAADAFHSAEPELTRALDAWVAATPASFAPYLARGSHGVGVGFARRGTKWARETPASDMAAMREAFASATADLDKALSLKPKLVAAYRAKIKIGDANGAEGKALIDQALKVCPTCFQVRVAHLHGLTPRWGGSHASMTAFARMAPVKTNPRLRLLAGYVDHDVARTLRASHDLKGAMVAIERACALGEHWEFLVERALLKRDLKDLPGALADLDRAAHLRPGHPDVLLERAHLHYAMQAWELAGRDLLAGLRADPTDDTGRSFVDSAVSGLVFGAWEHEKAGRRDDALRVYALAAEIAPSNPEVLRRRSALEFGTRHDVTIDELEAKAKASPDDFAAHRDLDYALARRRQFAPVIEMWNEFLARNPNEGRAYHERSGAYYHLGKMAESRADAAKACDLGVTEACAYLQRHPATP